MDFNYKRTRNHTIGKLVVMSLATLLPLVLVAILGIVYDFFKGEQALDLKIFRYVVLVVFETVIIYKIAIYIRIIASKTWAEKYFIKKHDERCIYIKQRTSTFTLKMVLYLCALGMVVTGFINKTLFYCFGGVIAVTLLTLLLTYLYFSKKI